MEHKRGSSFDYVSPIPDNFVDGYFVGWTVLAQVRQPNGTLVAALQTSWVEPATTRNLRLLAVDTSDWPTGRLQFDVAFTRTSDNYRLTTTTVPLDLVQGVSA